MKTGALKIGAMKIGIVGLGLIGGSLGLDLRQAGHQVYGVSRRQSTCEAALAQGMVDFASPALDSLRPAEVVFVCTPMATILPTIAQLTAWLAPTAIITDVGSVKQSLVEPATRLWPRFVGGHPMSGKAEAGLAAAEAQLFAQRPYVITPIAQTDATASATLSALATALGADLYYASPADHDRAVAWISHLPVMVSASLIQACDRESDSTVKTLAQQLASSGFSDTSRVGGGNPELGLMMAQYNQPALLRSLQGYRRSLDALIAEIETENWPALSQRLQAAQTTRPKYLKTPKEAG
jgi:arogenate dehydrogenase (NADP+)